MMSNNSAEPYIGYTQENLQAVGFRHFNTSSFGSYFGTSQARISTPILWAYSYRPIHEIRDSSHINWNRPCIYLSPTMKETLS